MARFRIVYEDLNGVTKVTFVNDVKTAEDAENFILCNDPDVLQVLNVSKV